MKATSKMSAFLDCAVHILICTCVCSSVCFAVVEVNVVDTSADQKVDDVTFPKLEPARQSSWSEGGNSIRLTGDTIKELGADG